jgi:menaquinol-cytochrome c reductase iron-sulfur subunit
MSGHEVSRRDFLKVTTTLVGGVVVAGLGLPSIVYQIDPAFKAGASEGWVPVGKVANMQVGVPYPFYFTRTQINGWERTSTSHGGFALQQSENPEDFLVLNSQCTHLACTVNWDPEAQIYVCPCHDGEFSKDGDVLAGPPPRPLERYPEYRVTDAGELEIFVKET